MTWHVPGDIAWCADPGEDTVWAVRAADGRVLGLNPSAFAAWMAADGKPDVAAVARELSRGIEDGAPPTLDDVGPFLDHLVEQGLLVVSNGRA